MTGSERLERYVNAVLDGEIPSNKWVRLACERFVRDFERSQQDDPEFPWYFDTEAADHVVTWVEKLPHTKGKWFAKKELLQLGDWQCFIYGSIFGWKHKETKLRRFLEAFILVPRKNGKSCGIAAPMGLYVMCETKNDAGIEVYCGASTEKQAWEVFRPARLIVKRTRDLREHYDFEVNAKSLVMIADHNRFEPVIGNPGDGPSPSLAITDEFHEHEDARQVETFRTGMLAREEPLLLEISTAGSNLIGPCKDQHDECCKILDQTLSDETIFCIMWGCDEGDKWDSIEALEKANPNLDVSVSRAYLLAEMQKARRNPVKQNAFKTKHLNQWVGAKSAWLNMLLLHRCKTEGLKFEDMHGDECWIGVDLASRIDLASACFLFKNGERFKAFWRHYLPEEIVYNSGNENYSAWAEAGLIITTPGNQIDFGFIEDDIKEAAKDVTVNEIAYDPYQATQFATRLEDEGFEMIEVRQTSLQFNEPMTKAEEIIYAQRLEFDDPVAAWAFGNTVCQLYGNLKKATKEREQNKIDPVVAFLMALKRALVEPDTISASDVYVA